MLTVLINYIQDVPMPDLASFLLWKHAWKSDNYHCMTKLRYIIGVAGSSWWWRLMMQSWLVQLKIKRNLKRERCYFDLLKQKVTSWSKLIAHRTNPVSFWQESVAKVINANWILYFSSAQKHWEFHKCWHYQCIYHHQKKLNSITKTTWRCRVMI